MKELIERDLLPAAKFVAWLLLCWGVGYMLGDMIFIGVIV
jgi:hypothetical protein